MPGLNGTGPRGQGAMTGRRMGRCEGGQKRGLGRGFGCRRGFFGRRFSGFFGARRVTKEEEKEILEEEAEVLKNELEEVKKHLEDLEK